MEARKNFVVTKSHTPAKFPALLLGSILLLAVRASWVKTYVFKALKDTYGCYTTELAHQIKPLYCLACKSLGVSFPWEVRQLVNDQSSLWFNCFQTVQPSGESIVHLALSISLSKTLQKNRERKTDETTTGALY